jgi:hypothetical protein
VSAFRRTVTVLKPDTTYEIDSYGVVVRVGAGRAIVMFGDDHVST